MRFGLDSSHCITFHKIKIWIYWFKSNSWIYFYIVLDKNWKMWWSEQSLTGLGQEDRCSSLGLVHILSFLNLNYLVVHLPYPLSFCGWSLLSLYFSILQICKRQQKQNTIKIIKASELHKPSEDHCENLGFHLQLRYSWYIASV